MNEKEQGALDSIAQETIKEQRKLAAQFSEDYLERLKSEEGMIVNTVDTSVKAHLAEKLNAPTQIDWFKRYRNELYSFVIREIDKVSMNM